MRIYKPGIMQTFTSFILTSEFEKSHLSLLFTRKSWEPQNDIITEILDGFKSMEPSILRMLKQDHGAGTIKGYMREINGFFVQNLVDAYLLKFVVSV